MILTFFYRILICVNDYLLRFLRRKFKMPDLPDEKPVGEYSFKLLHCEVTNSTNGTPLPRSGHRIVCDSKSLYSFGGYNPALNTNAEIESRNLDTIYTYPLFQELWKYNFASKKWQKCCKQETLPKELASNAVIRLGNFLMVVSYVFGGTGSPFGYRCSNQLHMCSLENGHDEMFEVVTTGSQPNPQYGQALVYYNGYLYTIGGTTGYTYTCDIHRLDIKSKKWESVYICQGNADYEPEGRYRHEVSFDGKNIYLLGGGTADKAFDFCKLPCFNIETLNWSFVKTKADESLLKEPREYGYPRPRRCHGAVQIETDNGIQVFIIGGYDGHLVFDDLWRLELSTLRWTLIKPCKLPRSIYFHSAAVSPAGKLHIFGGIYGGSEISRSNDIMSLWLQVPRLSEMCWEALLHYHPHIINLSKVKLINLGIPERFVKRLD